MSEPGTRSGPLLLSISSGAAQTHRVLIIYCFSCAALIRAAAEVFSLFSFHVSYHIFELCSLLERETLTTLSCRFRRFGCREGGRNGT